MNLIPLKSLFRTTLDIRESKEDLIHANYIRSPAYACYLSRKRPYLLHAHGDDVRYGLSFWQKRAIARASGIFYSTTDLQDKVKGVHIPQPVDVEKFQPSGRIKREKKAVYFLQTTSDPRIRQNESVYLEGIRSICAKENLELVVPPKMSIPYAKMPEFLQGFDTFFDREFPKTYSKTALESIVAGCKVYPEYVPVSDQLKYVLDTHDVRKVADKVKTEYEKILRDYSGHN